jgi:hypothetical protein
VVLGLISIPDNLRKWGVIIMECVQKSWREFESSISTLYCGLGIAVYDLLLTWCFLGHTLCKGCCHDMVWYEKYWGDMESCSLVFYVVYREREECSML